MGLTLQELESDPNILWFSHFNVYLDIRVWFYLWSSLEPFVTCTRNPQQATNYCLRKNPKGMQEQNPEDGFSALKEWEKMCRLPVFPASISLTLENATQGPVP